MHAGAPEDVQGVGDVMQDVIMMRLRTVGGLDLASLRNAYGSRPVRQIEKALERHERAGLVERAAAKQPAEEGVPNLDPRPLDPREVAVPGTVVRLADPEGFLVSNDIISDIFAELMP